MTNIIRLAVFAAFVLMFTKFILPTTVDVMIENARPPRIHEVK
jgi:hypothetical protein